MAPWTRVCPWVESSASSASGVPARVSTSVRVIRVEGSCKVASSLPSASNKLPRCLWLEEEEEDAAVLGFLLDGAVSLELEDKDEAENEAVVFRFDLVCGMS